MFVISNLNRCNTCMVIFDIICSDPEDVDDDYNLENLISEGVFKNIRRPTMQLTSCYPK